MRTEFFLILTLVLSKVTGLLYVLQRTQPLYGISSLVGENENGTCYKELKLLRESVEEGKVWALKVLDASGRPEAEFIYGNNMWLGSHSECKDISNTKPLELNYNKIKQLKTPYDYPPYPLGFTVIHVKHNSTLQLHTQLKLEFTIQLGLCTPKSCTKDEILNLSEQYFKNDYLEVQNLYNISMEVIEVKQLADSNIWILKLPKTIILSVMFIVIILLTIMGTILDCRRHHLRRNIMTAHSITSCNGKTEGTSTTELYKGSTEELEPEQSSIARALQCFSIYSNTINLVKTKLSSESISCIHGLRFLGMLWVVCVHSVFFQADFIRNPPFAYRLSEDFMSQTFTNSTYCVDTYLFLSGFLVGYLYYKSKNPHEKSTKPVNFLVKSKEFVMSWINRFFRLTPVYMAVLLFSDILFTFYRENSPVSSSEELDIVCDKYWWRNLLYINNLFPRREMCMSWSWYLSLDTQCFTVTIFLLILSTVAFKVAASGIFFLILVVVVSTTWKSYSIGYIPTMDEQLVQLDAIYDLPWNRMGPYLVGVITAYILRIKLQNKLVLKKRTLIFLWTAFPLINLWILFTLYTRKLSVEFSAIYMGISRTLWGVGMAWVVISCCTGNADTLQKFLSFRGFIPLSRLTYCVYLLNPIVATMVYFAMESTFEASRAEIAFTSFAITLMTYFMAYLFSVLIESPFILLTKMALQRVLRPKADSNTNTQT